MSCSASIRAGGWWFMAIDPIIPAPSRFARVMLAMVMMVGLCSCGTGPLVGLVYTNVKLPLTLDLKSTPVPEHPPVSDRIIEIKEPVSGLGMYARVSSNALGDIARQNGVDPLYFADQEVFSILGIWKTQRVFLYGETAGGSERHDGGATTGP
jgi:hypothetical protein